MEQGTVEWKEGNQWAVRLTWWGGMALPKHSGAPFHPNHFRHIHHCADCDCIIQCQYKGCKNPTMYCPDCDTKK